MNSKFCTKNSITSSTELTVSSGTNTRLLFDRRTDVQFSTSGETSGTRTIRWIPAATTTIDTIVIQNCNWDAFTVTYNGGLDFSLPILCVGNTDKDLYITFDNVEIDTTNGVLLSITNTMTAGVEVKCGELYIGLELFEAGAASDYTPKSKEFAFSHQLSDGTNFKVFIREIINFDYVEHVVESAQWINYYDLKQRNKRETFFFVAKPVLPVNLSGVALPANLDVSFVVGDYSTWNGLAGHYDFAVDFDIYQYEGNLQTNGYIVKGMMLQAGGVR